MHAPRACETWIGDCLRQWSACEPLKKSGSLPGSRATSRLVRQHIVTVSGFIDLSTHGEACLTIVALCARSKERAVAQLLAMLMDGLAGTIRSRCGGQKARRRELDANFSLNNAQCVGESGATGKPEYWREAALTHCHDLRVRSATSRQFFCRGPPPPRRTSASQLCVSSALRRRRRCRRAKIASPVSPPREKPRPLTIGFADVCRS